MYTNRTTMGESSSSRTTPDERSLLNKNSAGPALPEGYGAVEEDPTLLNDSQQNKKICTYILLFITVLTTLIVFLILWFAPTFAERTVKDSVQFKFQTASILNLSKANSMSLHVIGQIELEPRLYRWSQRASRFLGSIVTSPSRLSVLFLDQTLGTIELPALSLNDSSPSTTFDFVTDFVIQDTQALMAFCKHAVEAQTVLWHIYGPLTVHLGSLGSTLTLDKRVALAGMGGLKETEMQRLSFPGEHPLGGVWIASTVGLFNPSSVLSLRLGDVDFGIYLPGERGIQLAVVRASDARLDGRRMNYFNVSGRTLPFSSDAQELISVFLSRYLHGDSNLVHVRGSFYGPDPNLPSDTPMWLRQALEALTISVPFPGVNETDLIQTMALANIKIDFSSQQQPLISADATAILKQPKEFNLALNVNQIDPRVYIYLHRHSPSPFAFVRPNTPCPAQTEPSGHHQITVRSKLVKAPFKVLPGGQKDFQEFLRRVFYEKRGELYMHGTSDAQVESALGLVTVRDLDFDGPIEIEGMAGLGRPEVTSLSLVQGSPHALEISTALRLFNPSSADVHLGALQMALLFNGNRIGYTSIPSFALAANQSNLIQATAWLDANNPHGVAFISHYISTNPSLENKIKHLPGLLPAQTYLTISGDFPNATRSPWLRPLIQALTLDVPVPPFDKPPILADCRMNILSSTAVLSLRNPFPGLWMTILRINATATYKTIQIGDIDANFQDLGEGWKHGPILLPGPVCENTCQGLIVQSEKIHVKTKKVGIDAIRHALGGSIVISVESHISLMLGHFPLHNLAYIQNNITAKVRTGF
ncbi:hypothetical protein BY458DRAFT_497052 [Sporodiniella umbellata]|nr:hypothetical protein BY458DRAFT_497052 [Sporodiniella umbellata]